MGCKGCGNNKIRMGKNNPENWISVEERKRLQGIDQLPHTVAVTGKRIKLYVRPTRKAQCGRCSWLKRKYGLWWCGKPMPSRLAERIWFWLTRSMRLYYRGCGCILNIKWRLKRAECPVKVW